MLCTASATAAEDRTAVTVGWDAHVVAVPKPVPAHRPAKKPAKREVVTGAIASPPADPGSEPARSPPKRPPVPLAGIASYYWQGVKTASGERFDKTALTAAHPRLKFGTRVRVTHVANGRSVVVRINDRGPFKPGRIIDLSEAAADVIGMKTAGLAKVRLDILDDAHR